MQATSVTASLEVYGASQTTAALTDAGVTTGMLALNSSGSAAGNGGTLTFGNSQSVTAGSVGFAAIKGLLTNGSSNTIGDLAFSTRNAVGDTALTERMRILASGNVGIGTASPTSGSRLTVATASGNAYLDVARASQSTGQVALQLTGGTSGTNWIMYQPTSSDDLRFFGNSGDRMTITSAGNVGIGTTNPTDRLSVAVPTGTIEIASFSKTQTTNDTGALVALWGGATGDTVRGYLGFAHTGTGADTTFTGELADALNLRSEGAFQLGTNGNNIRLTVATAGNVGIGTVSPGALLDVSSAASSNPTFQLSDGDVAHGMTGILSTTATFKIQNYSSSDGGAWVTGASDAAGTPGISLQGVIGVTDPTDTVAGLLLNGSKKNTTSEQAMGALETVLQVETGAVGSGTKLMTILGNGNVGIGTTTPASKLDILGSSGDQLRLRTAGSEYYRLGRNSSTGLMEFYGSQSGYTGYLFDGVDGERMRITSAGNVGIGTTTPASKLQVQGDVNIISGSKYYFSVNGASPDTNWSLHYNSSPGGGIVSTAGLIETVFNGAGYGHILKNTSGTSLFEVQGSDGKAYFAGNVGIGTTTPTTKLTSYVAGSWAASFGDTSAAVGIGSVAGVAQIQGAGSTGLSSTASLALNANGGNVGIGTASPGSLLTVSKAAGNYMFELENASESSFKLRTYNSGSATANATTFNTGLYYGTTENASVHFYRGSGTTGGFLTFTTGAGTERMRIDGSGNVGIGTTTPTSALTVNGTTAIMAGSAVRLYNSTNSNYSTISSPASGVFSVSTGGVTNAVYVDNTGNVGIAAGNAPTQALNLYRTGSTATYMAVGNSNTGLNGTYFGVDTAGNSVISQTQALPIIISTNGVERMRILSGGNVGIGSTNPASTLDLGAGTNGRGIAWGGSASEGNYANIYAPYSTSGIVLATGFRGSTSADSYLSSYGSSMRRSGLRLNAFNDDGIQFFSDTAATIAENAAYTPTERMRITPSGNVGIGDISPSYALDIAGASGVGLQIQNTSDSNRGVRLLSTGSAGSGTAALNTTSSGYGLTFGIDSVEKNSFP
ncbi:MAG: YapH protein [Parcubacteria group bacterium Greene0714_7]|nr:MAG: YapH protein [Parcubacteria group bacterium Greene0714_7]